MPAHEWTTPEQSAYLHGKLPAYFTAKDHQNEANLTRFWSALDLGWFERWPEEVKLGLPMPIPGAPAMPMTDDQLNALGAGTQKTKDRLKAWMRYREKRQRGGIAPVAAPPVGHNRKTKRFLFRLLKKTKSTRPLRAVEMYQKMYGAKVKAEVMRRGYGKLNEETETERAAAAAPVAVEMRVLTEAETRAAELAADLLVLARVRKNRAARMKLWVGTASEMYAGESLEVRALVEAATADYNAKRAVGGEDAEDDAERTPEEYQHAIDQINTILAKVTDALMLETGWIGMVMLAGPMPRRGGQISAKTFCFGETANGNDFQGSHPNFDEDVKVPFVKFAKRCFPHEVRDARGLPTADDEENDEGAAEIDSLIAFDDDEAPTHQPPRRIRRKPRTTANVSTPATFSEPIQPVINAPQSAPSPAPPALVPSFDQPLVFPDDGSNFDILDDVDFGNMGGTSFDVDFNSGAFDYPMEAATVWGGGGAGAASVAEPPRAALSPARFPPPSVLFQAFVGRRGATGVTPTAFPPTLATPISNVANATPTSPTSSTTAPTTSSSLSASTPATVPPFVAAASTPISTSPRSTPATAPSPVAATDARSTAAPPPRGSAVASFTAMLAKVTAEVQEERAAALAPTPTPPAVSSTGPGGSGPQYIQSRPMANPPSGHPLAPAAKRAEAGRTALEAARAAKAAKGAKKGGVRGRGGPSKTAAHAEENGGGVMTEAARTETARVNREAAELRKTTQEMLRRGKAVEDQAAAAAAEEKRRNAALHNPAGDHDLFVTAARPKRAAIATKNPDGTEIIRPKKRTREQISREEDDRLVAAFKARETAPPKK